MSEQVRGLSDFCNEDEYNGVFWVIQKIRKSFRSVSSFVNKTYKSRQFLIESPYFFFLMKIFFCGTDLEFPGQTYCNKCSKHLSIL